MPKSDLTRLRKAFEKRERACLWVPADAITFVPRVSPYVYGNGRALFAIATINQRPAYWVVRACSEAEMGEFGDDILTDLEGEFGNGRCGHSGNSLFWPKRERKRWCECEDCAERGVAKWPMVDGEGGYSWGRMQWPDGFKTVRDDPYTLAARTEQPE